jgi:hypothetical protein
MIMTSNRFQSHKVDEEPRQVRHFDNKFWASGGKIAMSMI